MNIRLILLSLCVCLTNSSFAADGKNLDIVVNGGKRLTNSQTITIEPSGTVFYPQIAISFDPTMQNAQALKNPGRAFTYVLPRTNKTYQIFLQYQDDSGNPQGGLMFSPIELDTIPPVVKVESPKDGSTTDQGFVHVKATVFDPDPTKPTEPAFMSRRIAVWVNGESFWNIQGTQVDIPRLDVQEGTNKLSIVAEDEASNRTEAVVKWVVDLGVDKTPPVLSEINLLPDRSGKVILPNDPEVDVMGRLDDPMAIVTASVNGDEPVRVNVMADKYVGPKAMFFRRIPLNEGENSLVLSAIDGAGNASDYKYTLVRSDRYRCKVTSPDPGKVTAGPLTAVVKGYVSALRDPGTKTQARVEAVFVNDIPTTLEPEDAGGNIHFRTNSPVPTSWHGFPGYLYVRIKWSDGEEY